jgi:hypothetical protein
MNLIDTLVEVRIGEEQDFLKIKETLTRIGVASRKDNILYQSCHILHKQGKYYIVHFKELFALDGKPTDFSDEDRGRRNTIINLLQDWDLVKVVDASQIDDPRAAMSQIKILPHKDKGQWELVAKYNIGRKKV